MSYTAILNTTPINDTNAHFQAWGQNVSGVFSSAGWVKTGDTGQINWATVAAPSANLTPQGYEIWGMNDSLQATAPVYVKVEFGSSGNINGPAIWITVANNTDGNGNVIGLPSSRILLGGNSSANAIDSAVSGANNRIHMGLWCTGANGNVANLSANTLSQVATFINIERTKDTSGADTNDGVCIVLRNPNLGSQKFIQQYWNPLNGPTGQEDWGILFPTPNSIFGTISQTPVYPLHLNKGFFCNPILGVLGYVYPCFIPDTYITLNVYGSNHTYFIFNATTIGLSNIGPRAFANCGFMMRYE